VQDEAPIRLDPQVVAAGDRTYGPVETNVRPFAVCLPTLLIENVCGAVIVPSAVGGNVSAATLDSRMIAGEPVPARLTVAVGGIALLPVTVSVALSTPTTDGVNVT